MVVQYTYVSDSMLDVIVGQLPHSLLRRASKELKVDFKIISLSLKRSPSDDNRYGRLRVATDYIRRECASGSLDENPLLPWIDASVSLATARAGDRGIVYVGSSGAKTVCLIGSRRSVVGTQLPTEQTSSGTWLMVEDLLAQHEAGNDRTLPLDANDSTSNSQRHQRSTNAHAGRPVSCRYAGHS